MEIWYIFLNTTFLGSHSKIKFTAVHSNVDIPSFIYMANKIRKATIKQNRPIASDRANPKMAYENNCCFKEGFLKRKEKQLLKTNLWKIDTALPK